MGAPGHRKIGRLGRYFGRYLKEYRLSDANMFAEVRIGNF
jgi:hypothetical protein